MTEHNDGDNSKITLSMDNIQMVIDINDTMYQFEQSEKLFKIFDLCDKLNNIFRIRKKYSEIFTILTQGLLIHRNEDKWKDWEKTLLIMFTNYPYTTDRQAVWGCGIDSNNLRQIIHQKSDLIATLPENKLELTQEGLKYIIKKLDSELSYYRCNNEGENTDE